VSTRSGPILKEFFIIKEKKKKILIFNALSLPLNKAIIIVAKLNKGCCLAGVVWLLQEVTITRWMPRYKEE
jgi:hypothetical protein